jgi:hypothetical protein
MNARQRTPAATLLQVIGAAAIAAVALGCLPSGSRGSRSDTVTDESTIPTATESPRPTGPTPVPSYAIPTPTPYPTFLVYVVVRGDSLNTIAHKFGTTARSLAFWNRTTYPSLDPDSPSYKPGLLKVGWTLALVPNLVVDEDELPADTAPPSEATEP